MGVRFQCPHGHKLHVKAELAGKRGICPECGAKFVVPAFNGGRVPWDAGGGPPSPADSTRAPAAASPPQAAGSREPGESVLIQTQSPPVASDLQPPTTEPIVWYVRPAAGGQFGPATTEIFQQWIEDGRVAVDSWVWRTGWPDWKAGGEALAQIPMRQSPAPTPAPMPVASTPVASTAGPVMPNVGPAVSADALVGAAAQIEPASADVRRAEIKRRKDNVRRLSTVLALVALAMLMALVFVLAR